MTCISVSMARAFILSAKRLLLASHASIANALCWKQVPPFKKTLLDAMPYIDFLFGNETEARAFADSENWGTQDIPEIALKVARPRHAAPLSSAHAD